MKKSNQFKTLEILCLEYKPKTGKDVQVKLNGKSVIEKWSISRIDIEINPEKSIIKIYHFNDLTTGERFGDKMPRITTIDTPIKLFKVEYNLLGMETNNTPRDTKFFIKGREIKNNGFIKFCTSFGDANTINEFALIGC